MTHQVTDTRLVLADWLRSAESFNRSLERD